ncbi:MAG: TIGR00282 family metallophosphoesterase [Candidatus Dependentiae bacterium]|nr:TIGR00282 family metallophosphoesterase [Candidatus Dependentiae bacterium]
MTTIRVLFIGDVVGLTGRTMFQKHIDRIRQTHAIDAIIVNGENSGSQGRGITSRIAQFFKHNGANVITTGNHIWYNREIYSYLDKNTDVLRPANFPRSSPGVGVTTFSCKGYEIGVINVQGRVFMRDLLECPFRTVESLITYLKDKTNMIFVDFHAETTSEKMGLAYYLDGKISGLVGTHTHIQTADERILPGGTGYITDLGMVGSLNSMLGMQKEPIIHNFLTQMPVKFSVDTSSPVVMSGVWMEVDVSTGKTVAIERIRVIDDALEVGSQDDE